MTDGIDTVCFDLDDTLCTYTQPGEVALEAAFERVGVDDPWTIDAYHGQYGDYLEESADIEDLRRRCFGDLAVATGYDRETGWTVAQEYATVRDGAGVERLPGVRRVLESLSGEYRLGLITNGAPGMQRAKLESTGLAERFETVVCAGFDTAPKPDPEPFDVALGRLESTPERAAYVGNSLSSDVAGANAAGLRSIWVPHGETVPDRPDPVPDHQLESLAELPSLSW
ncbi:HAD family hydrolase [Natrarchaeobius halalkaliphilus]|uniref:HAD family hydrolase n=1 Tax=Natrarchaeobius halalkaliphilus TaxID=1679091 RepID=A0A3N6P0V1_9EURY|nr:HAD family hydrolase [Natrarchaeobius halalkaliphilus]RQG91089.1 HAD family hydrolase [Natrarchaeobius halalkaliphilus]